MSTDTKELRGDAPADLVRYLDALALSHDMDRNKYVVSVLMEHVKSHGRRLTLQNSMLKGNPLLTESGRNDAE